MRKIVLLAAAAVLALAACRKETPGKAACTSLTFGIEAPVTKTAVEGAVDLVWQASDAITVFTESGPKVFTLSEGAGSANGTFMLAEQVEVSSSATTFYPETLNPSYTDDAWHVTLPDRYDWSEGGLKAPMITWLNYPHFTLLCGVVKLDVYDIPANATKLVFTADGQNVSGEFVLNGSHAVETYSGSNNTVTIVFAAGAATNRTFYVPLPAGTYTNATFSIQSDSEPLKTVRAASLQVARGTVSFVPSLRCGAVAPVTIWTGPIDCSNWGWNQKDGLDLSMLREGDRLRIHVVEDTGKTYWQLEPQYWGTDWTPVGSYSLYPGQTVLDVEMTASLAAAVSGSGSLVVRGANVEVTSVEYIPQPAGTVLWKGNFDLGNWEHTFDASGLNTAAFWSGLKAGKTLTFHFREGELGIDYCQFYVKKKADSSDITGMEYNFGLPHQTLFSITLSEQQVAQIQESGIVIQGKNIIFTKISIQ